MKEFTFSGKIDLDGNSQTFERTVEANSDKHAKDRLYSELCSEHGVSRSRITVEEEE